MMVTSPTMGAVVFAKDVARVGAFYAAITGLAVTRTEPGWMLLESPAYQLVVHGIPEDIAADIDIKRPPVRREDTAVKLIFAVPSLASARKQAERLGGAVDPPEREWEFGAQRVCDGHDPEGNVIQLRQTAP